MGYAPFHSDLFKVWRFDDGHWFIIDNAYNDFLEFSKEYSFHELLKSKKKQCMLCNKD